MRIGVLGTGTVGRTIGGKLVALGHEVRMGSRSAGNEKAVSWAAEAGEGASQGDFAGAAAFGELIFNCTAGAASIDALTATGADNLAGKVLIDVANVLDRSREGPLIVGLGGGDSIGERIQSAFPDARVVKTLHTVNASVMVEPAQVPGEHVIFVCGDDPEAKRQVVDLVGEFGWPAERVIDLGEIAAARGPEMYVALWVRLMGALGTAEFNISIER